MNETAAFYFSRAEQRFDAGTIADGLADLDKAIELDPENADYRDFRAELRYNAAQYAEAIADFSIIIETISDQEWLEEIYRKRAFSYEALGLYEKLIDDLSWLIKEGTNVYSWRGHHYRQLGYYQKAISDFSKAHELSPNDNTILLLLGQCRYHVGEYHAALEDLTRVLENKEEQPTILVVVYHWRARTHSKLGNIPQALADFNQVQHIRGEEPIQDISEYVDVYTYSQAD